MKVKMANLIPRRRSEIFTDKPAAAIVSKLKSCVFEVELITERSFDQIRDLKELKFSKTG